MNNEELYKNTSKSFKWSDSVILDKIQEILQDECIDDLVLTEELIETIKYKLSQNISMNEITDSAFISTKDVNELASLPDEEIRDYILRLKNYLKTTTVKCIKAEFKGIEFEVYNNSDIDDVFKNYYSKYDEMFGISQMLLDLGLK